MKYKKFFPLKFLYLFFFLIIVFEDYQGQYKYNFRTFSNDFKEIIKQPSNWNSNDLLAIAGITGLTYGAMHFDSYIQESVLRNQQYQYSIPVEFGRIWGEPWFTAFLGGSLYIHGLASGNDVNKKIGFEIGESAFYTSIITFLLKFSFGRERPRENNDPFSFSPFSFKDDNFLSLNSGHTALAFSLSTILAENTNNDYLKVALYIPAFLTAFSRVYQNHHWTSDVILGSIIGYTIAEYLVRLHKPKAGQTPGEFVQPIPILNYKISF